MKQYVYYITPFMLVPLTMLLCEYLDNVPVINMTPYILIIVLALISVVMGNLSPTKKIFDYMMTIIMPLSFFCFLFIYGFLAKDDLETRFNLHIALRTVSQDWTMIAYGVMALTTFLASFKPIRIARWSKSHKNID